MRRGSLVRGERGRKGICLTSEGTMAVSSHEERVSHLRVTVSQAAPLLGRRELLTSHCHPGDFRFLFYVFVPVTTRDAPGLLRPEANIWFPYTDIFVLIHVHI